MNWSNNRYLISCENSEKEIMICRKGEWWVTPLLRWVVSWRNLKRLTDNCHISAIVSWESCPYITAGFSSITLCIVQNQTQNNGNSNQRRTTQHAHHDLFNVHCTELNTHQFHLVYLNIRPDFAWERPKESLTDPSV